MSEQQSRLSSGSRPPHRRPLRRRQSDPFSIKSDRDNFPGLDNAFSSGDNVGATPRMGSSSKRYASRSQESNVSSSSSEPSGVLLDQSVCSQASSTANSSLDMSIGARAALTEHLRHIMRYGLDGQEEIQEAIARNEQDEEWDRLMDGNTSVASWSTAPNNDTGSSLPGLSHMEPVYTVQADGNESVEIVTDLNVSDYFNSSRVQCLATPERNKHLQHGVTHRAKERRILSSSFDREAEPSPDCDISTYSQESGMINMFRAAMGLGQPSQTPHDSSFVSFSEDVSRISASFDDDEFHSSSPIDSFQQQRDANDFFNDSADIRDFIPPIERTTSGTFRDSSSSSTPKRGSPLRSTFTPKQYGPTGLLRTSRDKENEMPNFASLALSPIAAQAGCEAGRILRESGQVNGGTPFLDSASPIKKCRTPPSNRLFQDDSSSPISKAPSLLSYLPSGKSKSSGGVSSSKSGSSPRLKPKSGRSSPGAAVGIEEIVSPHSTTTKDDIHKYRQQFRTVVPSRVFLSDQDEFPAQDDSFSTPSPPNSSTLQDDHEPDQDTSRRSLLESFEAAYQNEPLS